MSDRLRVGIVCAAGGEKPIGVAIELRMPDGPQTIALGYENALYLADDLLRCIPPDVIDEYLARSEDAAHDKAESDRNERRVLNRPLRHRRVRH